MYMFSRLLYTYKLYYYNVNNFILKDAYNPALVAHVYIEFAHVAKDDFIMLIPSPEYVN